MVEDIQTATVLSSCKGDVFDEMKHCNLTCEKFIVMTCYKHDYKFVSG
jgi:hypothetical protein